jgi:hypothetical protein
VDTAIHRADFKFCEGGKMTSYSERITGNNDGMDPDWKPIIVPIKYDLVESLMELYHSAEAITIGLQKNTDEEILKHNWSVTLNGDKWVRLIKALRNFEKGYK